MDSAEILASYTSMIKSANSITELIHFRKRQRQIDCTSQSQAIWTNIVLNCLSEIGRNNGFESQPYRRYLTEDSRGQKHNAFYDNPINDYDCGEFLCDLCWYDYGMVDPYWAPESKTPILFSLALESEWGLFNPTAPDDHCEIVADDFCKLLHIDAVNRILITQADAKLKSRLIEILTNLRQRAGRIHGDVVLWYWDYQADFSKIGSPEVFSI